MSCQQIGSVKNTYNSLVLFIIELALFNPLFKAVHSLSGLVTNEK